MFVAVWIIAIAVVVKLILEVVKMATPDPLAAITQAVADLTTAVQQSATDIVAAVTEIGVAIAALKSPGTPVGEVTQLATAIEAQVSAIKASAQSMVNATAQLTAAVPTTPVTIAVKPSSVSLSLAGTKTQQLAVSDSTGKDVTASCSYASDNAAVAVVNTSGLVAGVAPGTANMTVTLAGSVPATVPVTVTA